MADACIAFSPDQLTTALTEKVRTCLFDLIGCAFESLELPWSMQAKALVQPVAGNNDAATIIGSTVRASYTDAAFVNAVMGHGLVREDMHSGSISHLGIVVLPTLLALTQYKRVSGKQFCAAVVAGYEVGAKVGHAAMSPEIARIHRPTGISGPIGAAAGAAHLLGLDRDAMTNAIALATNTTLGFNQWAHTGGSEMFFQAGFAARNALTAARLAGAGAFASPNALDGEAGLFASLGKLDAASRVSLFDGEPEIMAVYHKPVPACNFAQTPSMAALAIARERVTAPNEIKAIHVRVSRAGMLYPGCNSRGPFEHILQAKMSIQYNVAAALLHGRVAEDNFRDLNDPALHRLISIMTLDVDDAMTRAYPGKQGGEVEVIGNDGKTRHVRLDDVVHASAEEVRTRFSVEAAKALGDRHARQIEEVIDAIEHQNDVSELARLLASG